MNPNIQGVESFDGFSFNPIASDYSLLEFDPLR